MTVRKWIGSAVAAVIAAVIIVGVAWYGTQSDLDDTHQRVLELMSEQ